MRSGPVDSFFAPALCRVRTIIKSNSWRTDGCAPLESAESRCGVQITVRGMRRGGKPCAIRSLYPKVTDSLPGGSPMARRRRSSLWRHSSSCFPVLSCTAICPEVCPLEPVHGQPRTGPSRKARKRNPRRQRGISFNVKAKLALVIKDDSLKPGREAAPGRRTG